MSPKRVLRYKDDIPHFEIIWELSEWCRYVPQSWLAHCGCNRCCENIPDEWKRMIERDGLVMIEYRHGVPYFVVKRGDTYCLAPWPKRIYARLLF